jgi:hypothetical protein
MLLLSEIVNVRSCVLFVNSALATRALDVGELVHTHGVLLVKGNLVQLSRGCSGLGR